MKTSKLSIGLLCWAALVVAVALLVDAFQLRVLDTGFFRTVDSYIPSLDRWSRASSQPDAFAAAWLSVVFTAPVLSIYLLVSMEKGSLHKPLLGAVILAPALYFLTSVVFTGTFLGIDVPAQIGNPRIDIYRGSFSGGMFVTLLLGGGFVVIFVELFLALFQLVGFKTEN